MCMARYTEDAFAPSEEEFKKKCAEESKYTLPSSGGKPKNNMTATKKRVTVGKAKRVVYKGPRGGEYVKVNGKMVSLKSLKL